MIANTRYEGLLVECLAQMAKVLVEQTREVHNTADRESLDSDTQPADGGPRSQNRDRRTV